LLVETPAEQKTRREQSHPGWIGATHIASKRQDLNTEDQIARKPINAEQSEADGMKARAVSGQYGRAMRESAEVP
jgi:hypothetical protein